MAKRDANIGLIKSRMALNDGQSCNATGIDAVLKPLGRKEPAPTDIRHSGRTFLILLVAVRRRIEGIRRGAGIADQGELCGTDRDGS
ncbi:hypothetical protein JCM30471_27590 [Desulfuromonas carbonis]|uniref:hypothetical protein n=1 Tax=Desulfuromonas sp. DDH964 TaxID=1823759 RepID=UPI00082B7043|nr:hypothetical protein [Desulfuromonas sp. DDH964]